MGHTIQHYDYPGNADKKKVEQELANYVAKRCFQEGGHLSKIRWIDSEPCANEDEAHEKIERLDKGWYDCIAVKYYDTCNVPETEKIKTLRAASTQAYRKCNELSKCEIGIYRLQKLRFQDCTKIPAKKLLPCL